MNIELGDIGNWLTANKLSLNVHKSKYMIYSKSKKLNSYPKLKIDDSIIQQVHEFNFLGITFDDHFNWKLHIERCAFKCSRNIGMLNKLNRFLPTTIMLTLYHTLIHSHLSYCIMVWGHYCDRIRIRIRMFIYLTHIHYRNIDMIINIKKWTRRPLLRQVWSLSQGPPKYDING